MRKDKSCKEHAKDINKSQIDKNMIQDNKLMSREKFRNTLHSFAEYLILQHKRSNR